MKDVTIVEKEITVTLTEDELGLVAKKAMDLESDLHNRAMEQQKQAQEFLAFSKKMEQEINELMFTLNTKKQKRLAKCVEWVDVKNKKVKTLYNGQVIESRPATDQDLQLSIEPDLLPKPARPDLEPLEAEIAKNQAGDEPIIDLDESEVLW